MPPGGGTHDGGFVTLAAPVPTCPELGARAREVRPANTRQPFDLSLVRPAFGTDVDEPRWLGQGGVSVALGPRGEDRKAGDADEPRRVTLAEPVERACDRVRGRHARPPALRLLGRYSRC